MNVRVINLTGVNPVRIPNPQRESCTGAVFRDDYARCTNIAIKRKGKFIFCAPHARKDELEVVVDTSA